MTIIPIRHKIQQKYLETDSPLLFFRNALSLDGQFSEDGTPIHLSYPNSNLTLGFHPSFNYNVKRQLNSELEGALDRPSMIISTEPGNFENVIIELYFWGALYVCSLLSQLAYLTFVLFSPIWMNRMDYYIAARWGIGFKELFNFICLFLTVLPLMAMMNRIPLLMMIYKASYPTILLILCTFYVNFLQDLFFLLAFLLARFSISNIQYNLVSFIYKGVWEIQ